MPKRLGRCTGRYRGVSTTHQSMTAFDRQTVHEGQLQLLADCDNGADTQDPTTDATHHLTVPLPKHRVSETLQETLHTLA